MPDRSRCPNCGERVSPYAAGCAVCGADIDFRRWDSGPGPLARAGSWLSALSHGGEVRGVPVLLVGFMVMFGGSLIAAVAAVVR
jgi:hypothetical protein